jgi:hypothetical protein
VLTKLTWRHKQNRKKFKSVRAKSSTRKLRPNLSHVLLTRLVFGSDPSPKPVFMTQSYQVFLLWLQSSASLPGQVAPYPVPYKHVTHYKRKCYSSMYNFTAVNVNGSYMFRLHKVVIIRILLCFMETQRGYHTIKEYFTVHLLFNRPDT